MAEQKITWARIADSAAAFNWQENGMCIIEINGKKITLARQAEQLFAFAHKCPHASGIMANGFIDGQGQVVCPVHRYRFNMLNGRNTSGEGYYLKVYKIESRADGVYLGIEEKGLFGWAGLSIL